MNIIELLNQSVELNCIHFTSKHVFLNELDIENTKAIVYYWHNNQYYQDVNSIINDGMELVKMVTYYSNNIIIIDVI